jgi:ATP-dependent helicase/nuclease subunit A
MAPKRHTHSEEDRRRRQAFSASEVKQFDMTLKDQVARDTIGRVLDKNLMVLAGAGSGKTHELVARMVNVVRTGTVAVDRIAAITFTRKAAGEMRGRFFAELKACAQRATGEEAHRLGQALEKVDRCFIGTIHSFCGQLLRERPVEAGLPPDFLEVDDREESLMRRENWDQFVQRSFANEDIRVGRLQELGLRTEDLFPFFERRCQFGDVQLKPTSVDKPDLERPVLALRAFLDRVEPQIPEPSPGGRDAAQMAVRRARLFLMNRSPQSDADHLALLKILAGNLKVVLKSWAPHQVFAKEFRDDLLPEFQTRILDPVLTHWRQYVYQFAAEFVDEAAEAYAEHRKQNGRLTFQDLLELSARVLQNTPALRAYFQDRYRCLFVDEFQDTDPIQAEVLLYLTGEDIEEKNWRLLKPRAGNLFLVGDGQQSIYRFRRADVETFRLVAQKIVETGSQGNLCDWVNGAFEPLFAAEDKKYQADFGPLYKHRENGDDVFSTRKLVIEKESKVTRAMVARKDAERIADFIAAALRGDTEFNGLEKGSILSPIAAPSDFLILTRTAGYLSHYAEALEARGIPFDMTGGSRLGESDELMALVDMLETIYRRDDPLPLLAYLRGDWVGLGDDELYAFKEAGGTFDWTAPVPEGICQSLHTTLSVALGRIKRTEQRLKTEMPGVAIEQCLEELGLMAFVRDLPMGATRAGNVMRVLALVRQWQSDGLNWGQMLCEFRAMIDDPDYKIAQMTLAAGQRNVVQLMNLHQSKGLQGRVVFLADPHDARSTKFRPEFHVSRVAGEPFLSLPVSKPNGPYATEVIAEPIGWAEDEAEEARFLKGEELRLLYVAATRAENLLVISMYEGQKEQGSWAPLYPFLDEVPELAHYRMIEKPAPDRVPIDLADFKAVRAAFWADTRSPTYSVKTVTTERDETAGSRSGVRRGTAYGTALHKLFDDAIHKRIQGDPSSYIRHLLLQVGGSEDFVEDANHALKTFRASEIWRELATASRVYSEVPFAVAQDKDITRGVMDLVYQLKDGWHIVDYKTDAVVTDEEVANLVNRVSGQISAYARYWENFTGETVVVKRLWLTECERAVIV